MSETAKQKLGRLVANELSHAVAIIETVAEKHKRADCDRAAHEIAARLKRMPPADAIATVAAVMIVVARGTSPVHPDAVLMALALMAQGVHPDDLQPEPGDEAEPKPDVSLN